MAILWTFDGIVKTYFKELDSKIPKTTDVKTEVYILQRVK